MRLLRSIGGGNGESEHALAGSLHQLAAEAGSSRDDLDRGEEIPHDSLRLRVRFKELASSNPREPPEELLLLERGGKPERLGLPPRRLGLPPRRKKRATAESTVAAE